MPGYANWKTLYREESLALWEAGYRVDRPSGEVSTKFLPFPEQFLELEERGGVPEADWEVAYWKLWAMTEQGQRENWNYAEPDDLEAILRASAATPQLLPLTDVDYAGRIAGAWLGKCTGVVLGKPLEMGFDRAQVREYLASVDRYPLADWVPIRSEALNRSLRSDCLPSSSGQVHFVQPDDDIHYLVLALLLCEKKGIGFTKNDVLTNWVDNIPYHWTWCSSRQAYYRFVNFVDEPSHESQMERIPYELNPWRECIDGQLRGDLWGMIQPGSPHGAARLAYRDCSVSLVKNGVYGGMFVAGCVAGALSAEPSVDTILDAGLSVIPSQSRLAEAVRKVRGWYAQSQDWQVTDDLIQQTWGHLPFAGAINNMAKVVLSLLHGNLNHSKTITTAVMAGLDTDCNAGTAGCIVGAAVGTAGLESRWVAPLQDTVKTVVADFGEGKISDLIGRTVRLRQA